MIKRDKLGRFVKGSHVKTEFKKGHIPWHKNKKIDINKHTNYGMNKKDHTEKTIKKIRKAAKKIWQNLRYRKKQILSHKNYKPTFGGKHFDGHKQRSKKTIDKIKQARAKQILPKYDTKIEVKIQNFLKKIGIEFFTHQYIKIEHGYQCDIFIPLMNLVIECDGDYWHSYPTGTEIDHIRTKELIEKGFKVLRLWEFEIKEMDLNDFKDRIKRFK